ncbi:MAG TPA: prohibitin family protein [Candidatus Didemnitutus sp.]|nr:prohibitin family protein [Candidatus Didemnitutus sp.]
MADIRDFKMNINPPSNPKKILLWILGGFVGLVLLIIVLNMSVTISGGQAGVLFRTFSGGIDRETTYGEGFHVVAPWNDMIVYEVRQQEAKETMAVLSSNGLEISLDVSGWFQPLYNKLPQLHQEKGQEYLDRVVRPALRSATRSVIGRYTPEEIYSSKRDAIQDEIYIETKKILDKQYVQLNEVLVRDITLPGTLKTAIENKLKQEQESLEYEFKLSKAQKEAERQLIDAEGKARANRILSASLTDMILREKGIEATLELARSPNAKIVVVGNKDGMPLILGNQ